MPYDEFSSEEENLTASSSTANRGGRRLLGRNLRRRRGDINADSSDENDDGDDLDRPRKSYTETTTTTTKPDRNHMMSPLSQEAEGHHSQPETTPTQPQRSSSIILDDPDSDTMRILVSTDNHLGYAENDNVRGNDSFAALEEVLYLAKEYSCDMVMLAGDLFHENRPSRRTLFKTMDIFRRYCMGPGAIQLQVVSGSTNNNNNQNKNHKSPLVRGYVNYEDANYSVDLPVFSIHGNHDDPSRDGGNSELYAALDLLDVVNLVNYFGKQEDTTNIRVDPILLRKGNTQVALYGLGSMRDERLNRMWRGGNLTFSRPAETAAASNSEDNNPAWFNIFALHQNRDRGRGAKNCIKEDMIPEWIDFVCWGHEHECDIELTESVVGTFRISQPGSSVATSLIEGESMRKKVAVLDVREGQFRLTSIPLTQIRSFVVSTVKLAEEPLLDPDDPKVDAKVSKVLEEKVRVLIHDAREKRRELLRDAKAEGNGLARYCEKNAADGIADEMPLKHTLHKEDEVLVRLKVDHTGFAAVNNQRFGAKFVGSVANPTDVLLFHRKKTESNGSHSKSLKDIAPIEPTEIEEMNIEELIVEQFESNTTKLELFDDKKISLALDSYVGKQEARAINEALEKLLGKQQNRLIKNGTAGSAPEGMAMTPQDCDEKDIEKGTTKRKATKRNRDLEEHSDYEDESIENSAAVKSRSIQKTSSQKSTVSRKQRASTSFRKNTSYDESDSENSHREDDHSKQQPKPSRSRATLSRTTGKGRKSAASCYEDSEDNGVRLMDPPLRNRRKTSPTRKRAAKKNIVDYSMDESDDDDIIVVDDPSPPKRARGRGRAPVASTKKASTARKRGRESIESSSGLSQSQLSFQPVKGKAASRKPTTKFQRRARTTREASYNDSDSHSGDSFTLKGQSYEDDGDDWGTAKSASTS